MANLLTQNPNSTTDRFASIFDDLFDAPNFFNGLYPTNLLSALHPVVDVKKNDKEYTFTMEVPGFNKEDIQVELNGDTLSIKGKRLEETEEKNEQYIRRERRSGTFQRSFRLDEGAKADDVHAECKNGILTIKIPKTKQAESRTIAIR